ncbi:sensor histidine kinase [Thiofilum flexile]|uniref:sensor histidine kinase n=1 Tax=Thiofilum flexile TaxID=125627 RepID=UPI00037B6FE6|nr:ATP-binding protein [Thiofilum flexile]
MIQLSATSQPIPSSALSRQFIVFLLSILIGVSSIFLILFSYFYYAQLTEERARASVSVSLLLKSSLERAMLRRDLVGLQEMISELGTQKGIKGVMVLNPQGEVRFASDMRLIGQQQAQIIQHFCPQCSAQQLPLEPISHFITTPDHDPRLRTFHPVRNKPACLGCHGTIDQHPVNGILVVDHEISALQQHNWQTLLFLMVAGFTTLALSAGATWWFMRRYVLAPIQQLHQASASLSQGNLQARVAVQGHNELSHLGKTFNQMAEHLQASHNQLQDREQFLQGLIDGVPDGVRVIDQDYKIIIANQAYAQQTGYCDAKVLRQQCCYAITYQRDTPCPSSLRTCPLETLNDEQASLKFIETIQRPDHTLLHTEVYAARLSPPAHNLEAKWVVEAVRDLDQAVHYSHEQKLSALGELAAGVAHEIHNPLASVRIALQASDTLLNQTPTIAQTATELELLELKDYLRLVDEQVEQCLSVTHRLMKLGTLSSNHIELVEVNSVITETLSLLRFEREQQHIEQVLDLCPQRARILAADNDLRMIILNLVQNAFHAMPQGGVLTLRTQIINDMVQIEVQDTGVGVSAEIVPHIFDPFFSRRVGQTGSGLGLTIVRSLMTQHHGTIQLLAHQAGHTIFRLTFPDADQAVQEH